MISPFYSIRQNARGFTLIEMLLVLVIISAIIMTGMNYFQQRTLQNKVDKTSLEMQQILTAAMTFYAAKGVWPNPGAASTAIIDCLTGDDSVFGAAPVTCDLPLLPNVPLSPWLQAAGGLTPYNVFAAAPPLAPNVSPAFFVSLPLAAATTQNHSDVYARMIAVKMPLGYVSGDLVGTPPNPATPCTAGNDCVAVSSVMPPGQSLKNAGNVNFAGTYHHGGCVPVPECPNAPDGTPLVPEVFLVPTSITGYFDAPVGGVSKSYPITSFTAYVRGSTPLNATPPDCDVVATAPQACPAGGNYWRACVDIQTQQGAPQNASAWSNQVYVTAFTRCKPRAEREGGGIGIFE